MADVQTRWWGIILSLDAKEACVITDSKMTAAGAAAVAAAIPPPWGELVAIGICVANEKIRFARFRPFPFWKRVHDSFISSGDDE